MTVDEREKLYSVIDVSVSSEQIHRAYLIMDTLIKSIEQLEEHIETENHSKPRVFCDGVISEKPDFMRIFGSRFAVILIIIFQFSHTFANK